MSPDSQNPDIEREYIAVPPGQNPTRFDPIGGRHCPLSRIMLYPWNVDWDAEMGVVSSLGIRVCLNPVRRIPARRIEGVADEPVRSVTCRG